MAIAAKQLVELGYVGPKLTTGLDNSTVQAAHPALNDAEFASFIGPTKKFSDKYNQA